MNNYEKKYKEALNWMQSLYDGLHGATKKDAEHYFPELKESDDEKIRKWLLDTITQIPNDSIEWDVIEKAKVLAWLEKQREQDPYNGVSFKCNVHTWGMCARDNGVDILLDRQLIKHLEKQGEQKQDHCDSCKDAFIEKACDAYCKVCGHYAHDTPTHICRQACDYYKSFKNYMKGE